MNGQTQSSAASTKVRADDWALGRRRECAGYVRDVATAARARAALDGRDFVIPDDVKLLALPALRHRVLLSPAAEIEGKTTDETLSAIIEQTAAPR